MHPFVLCGTCTWPKYHDNTNLVPIPKELHDQLEHVCAVTQVRDITRDTGDGMMEGE